MDFKELVDHLGLESAAYCGWSMGAAILWGYIDLFGTKGIRKVAFVDEPTPSTRTRTGRSRNVSRLGR
jgi:non-heme chloroperoxidase